MMIIIHKDDATKISREVKDEDEVRALMAQGFTCSLVNEDGSTTPIELPKAKEPKAAAKVHRKG